MIKMRYIFYILGGGGFFPPFVHVDKGGGGCKMSTLVHSRGGGGRNWSKFGPRSCWMPPYLINKNQTRDSISYRGKIQHAETSSSMYLHYFRSPQVNPRLSENDIPCKFKIQLAVKWLHTLQRAGIMPPLDKIKLFTSLRWAAEVDSPLKVRG